MSMSPDDSMSDQSESDDYQAEEDAQSDSSSYKSASFDYEGSPYRGPTATTTGINGEPGDDEPGDDEPGDTDNIQVPGDGAGDYDNPVPGTSQHGVPDEVVRNDKTKSVYYRGYSYSYYWASGLSERHRCSVRRRTGCRAKLAITPNAAWVEGVHKPACNPDRNQPAEQGPPPVTVDCKEQMLDFTDTLALRNVTMPLKQIWLTVRDRFYGDVTQIFRGATKTQVLGRLYRTRAKHFGREIYGRIESEPLCNVKNSPDLKFFRFHFTYYEDEVLHRVIGWGHPNLVDRMKQRQSSLFMDATYKCVPTKFYQLVILMTHDAISDVYLPVFYVLTTGKTGQVYEHLLHFVFMACDRKLRPTHVVCDFEYAMIKAAKNQFPEARIIGCLFHFKQAFRRKLLKLRIPLQEVAVAMAEGCLDKLTVIRRSEIMNRGQREVKNLIKDDCEELGIQYSTEKWKRFWKYFKNTWIKKFKPESWNIYGLREDIVNRTNNPLERYNRALNEAFAVPHPDVTQFIGVIEEQSRQNAQLLDDISNRIVRAPAHEDSQSAPGRFSDSDNSSVVATESFASSDESQSPAY